MTQDAEKRQDVEAGMVIEELYALVANPEQYDAFMMSLHEKMNGIIAQAEEGDQNPVQFDAHFERASDLIDVVTPWRKDPELELHRLLEKRMQAMMALDAKGRIVDSNDAAKVLYNLTPGANHTCLPLDTKQHEDILRRVREAISKVTTSNSPNNVVPFQKVDSGKPLLVTLTSHTSETSGETFAILSTNEVGWPSHLNSILQDLFLLTRAEVEVLHMMVEGARVNEIAERRNAAIATVRTQLASIYAKTGTSTQMECMRMVFGLSLMHGTDEGRKVAERIQSAQSPTLFPREDQHHLFQLPNGRQIDYTVFGAQDGAPLLFYHCQTWGDVWFPEAVQEATDAGFKVIAPLRPGYGQTSLYEGNYSDPVLFAQDLDLLLEHLGVVKAPILSVSTGLVHALATAALTPSRVISITAAHPWLPIVSREDCEGYNGFNKVVARARLKFPQALRFLVKSGFAYVSKAGPEAFARSLLRDSPKDVEWVTRPDNLPITVHGLKTHAQGYLGGYGDIAYREDWRPLLQNCPVPVRFVIGEHDRNVQWRSARSYADTLDHVTLQIARESGYLVHHQHSTQILKWIQSDTVG